MVEKATETCKFILIYDKSYFIRVYLLVYDVRVNIPYCTDMEETK